MEQPVQFRPAFNGFNREDVVRYMEYINNKHSARIAQLTNELDFLRSHDSTAKVAELEQQLAQAEAKNQVLTSRIAELEQQKAEPLHSVQAESEAPDFLLDKLEAKWREPKTAPAAEREPAYSAPVPMPAPVQTSVNEELEAYRRAERAERIAKERALQVSNQTAAVLVEASQKVDIASDLICQISRQVAEQLEIAQAAVLNSRQAFQEASSVIENLRSQMKE